MPYIPPEVVTKAKEMDLLTYLKNYEPGELVHFGGSTYCTRTHDSLKISNGKWCWFSRGIGGKTALDCNRRSPTATGAVANGHSAVRQRPA